MGRAPDYQLSIRVPTSPTSTNKYVYFRVGSAWQNPSGTFSIDMITMPGVSLMLLPIEAKESVQDTQEDF